MTTNYFKFCDVLEGIVNPFNPVISDRCGYVLVIKKENDGFYGIIGRKGKDISDEYNGLLLNKENSDITENVFFDFNNLVFLKDDYDNKFNYRWTLKNHQKNYVSKGIISAYENEKTPEEFKIIDFLRNVDYKPFETNQQRAEVSMISKVSASSTEENNVGKARTRSNVVSR